MLKRTTTTTVAATRAARPGFTLMEMLVVVAIIVIIAGAATPLVLNYLHNARVDRAKMDIKTLDTAVGAYYAKHHVYPESLLILTQPDPDYGTPAVLDETSLKDPWGQMYQYDPSQPGSRGQPRIFTQIPNTNAPPITN